MPDDDIIIEPKETRHVLPIEDRNTDIGEITPPPPIKTMLPTSPSSNPSGIELQAALDVLLATEDGNRVAVARQLRRALELLVQAVPLTEKELLEIPDIREQGE